MKCVRNNKCDLLVSLLAIVFISFGLMGGCNGENILIPPGPTPTPSPTPTPIPPDADLVLGGLLYDKFWVAAGIDEPEGTNPVYPTEENAMFSDPPRAGSQTWRCKECHGWDYLGVDGFYGPPSSHFTNVPGILEESQGVVQTRDHSPEEIFDIIKFGIPGSMFGYGAFLSDDQIWDLVQFVVGGLIDDRLIVDYSSPDMNVPFPPVDLNNGAVIYEDVCAGCHGMDGEGLEAFDTLGVSLNEVALSNPVEFIHKMRFGNPGTSMPSSIDLGLSTDDVKDVLAYAQEVLPNPPEPPPGTGCCVIAENDCVDDQTQAECDGLGGALEEGLSCTAVPMCNVEPPLDGAAIYADNCEVCHGVNGEGGFTGVNVVGVSAQQISDAIAGNAGGMGSLDFLSAEEIQAIADFLAP